ncbi:hypothetical protein JCM16303_006353 [Sporobolomyces ruberrimus]
MDRQNFAETSPLPLPPPVPPKFERRISIKSITASIRRSTSFSLDSDQSLFSPWSSDGTRRKARRPSSLFSWRSNRGSVFEASNEKRKGEGSGKGELEAFERKTAGSRKLGHRIQLPSSRSSTPQLIIEVDSLPSLFTPNYRPTASPPPDQASVPPSLPDFRRSTFQPLSCDNFYFDPTFAPALPPKVSQQLASRGPFPNRPLSTLSVNQVDPLQPLKVQRTRTCQPDTKPSGTRSSTADIFSASTDSRSPSPSPSVRLEPRSPRVQRRARSRPASPAPPPVTPVKPRSLPSLPPPPSPSSSSSSMIRSPSFTLSLPTVAEIPASPTPAPQRKLRPIVIAPRTPPTPSSPGLSHSSTASSSPSFISFDTHLQARRLEEESPMREEKENRIDWDDLEKRLRNLSEDRLHILLAELKRNK